MESISFHFEPIGISAAIVKTNLSGFSALRRDIQRIVAEEQRVGALDATSVDGRGDVIVGLTCGDGVVRVRSASGYPR
jgi:hypothetical protein